MTWALQAAAECASPHQVWAEAVAVVAFFAAIAFAVWAMTR
jgi:hypothetical protein